MYKPSFYLAFSLFLASAARAQNLPAPAPQPVKAAPGAKAPASEPLIIDNPPSTEPIIVGEPVRHQSASAPSATKPAAATGGATNGNATIGSVAGVSIAGLSDGNAVARLKTALAPQLKTPVRLIVGEYQYTFGREELGASLPLWPLMRAARAKGGDVPLRLQLDEAKLTRALQELDGQVRADFEETALNIGASRARIKIALEAPPISSAVTLVTIRVPKAKVAPPQQPDPETKKDDAPEPGQVKDNRAPKGKYPFLLASYATRYDASLRGRTTNLRMAAQHINGTVVAPGATFSANAAIGPRNAAAGWREAKMFVSGQVVSGTGAGICQAASTLYNAALLANVPIVERHAHSMRVMYVPPSRDAALMWGSKDFKFRNNTEGAIRVQTLVAGGQFHVKLWGQTPPSGAAVRIVSRVLSSEGGTRSEAYKVVGAKKTRLSRDSYKPHP